MQPAAAAVLGSNADAFFFYLVGDCCGSSPGNRITFGNEPTLFSRLVDVSHRGIASIDSNTNEANEAG